MEKQPIPEMVEIMEIHAKLSEGISPLQQELLDDLMLIAALMAEELKVCREKNQQTEEIKGK